MLGTLGVVLAGTSCRADDGEVGSLPAGFVRLAEVAPTVQQEPRYATADNFVGEPIHGYEAPTVVLTVPAAQSLRAVQQALLEQGLSLKVFDAYRPQRAVLHFVRWARDEDDQRTKATYYPDVPKAELFERGYIALESGHSRGSTVDVSLLRRVADGTWQELPMGTPFDFFGPESASSSEAVSAEAQANRKRLRAVMEKHGWIAYEAEWWHFTLRDEPYPETYFDFVVR
ncbi:M15 family metallopeptidase [Actomonas aquatica]|uniref:D-alanyl-D-alanine dipeptidase n=1 Tax=Actomonas aquatica TaxID=2866162 RepID=A0ABZ1C925_9BACT|nr:M15 family metallopeptidase [Opitutus sp. WL0086]WRQ87860.1 M15 family metallopeptidase [Opitutus sp. WL0086]